MKFLSKVKIICSDDVPFSQMHILYNLCVATGFHDFGGLAIHTVQNPICSIAFPNPMGFTVSAA